MSTSRRTRSFLAAFAAGFAATAVLVAAGPLTTADRPHERQEVTVVPLSGDDNGDGRIDEDESGWDCTRMGNRVCGPNTQLARY
ncbi:hypothetical protein [Streptomyces sp. NPDC058657]|uniref:hypothetical protein n=1 Tax=unclassified Streptomyces TaxID=2593676 RepID=UPI00364AE835